MFELAHITDVHLGPLPRVGLRQLMSKRFFGYLSWHRRRHRTHRVEVLDTMIEDLAQTPPDHIAVTGDLVNIALPLEFAQAGAWLQQLGPGDRVSVVPGNHDAYAGTRYEGGWAHWAAYMQGDEAGADRFPYLRRRGAVALVGLSSAMASPIGYATGRLGRRQTDGLAAMLESLRGDGVYRILLIHHPPLGARIERRRNLRDEAKLLEVVRAHGAELVLSGHQHHFLFGAIAGADGPVPVFGGPSASLLTPGPHWTGGYLRYRFDPRDRERPLEVELRQFDRFQRRMRPAMRGHVACEDGRLVLHEERRLEAGE